MAVHDLSLTEMRPVALFTHLFDDRAKPLLRALGIADVLLNPVKEDIDFAHELADRLAPAFDDLDNNRDRWQVYLGFDDVFSLINTLLRECRENPDARFEVSEV